MSWKFIIAQRKSFLHTKNDARCSPATRRDWVGMRSPAPTLCARDRTQHQCRAGSGKASGSPVIRAGPVALADRTELWLIEKLPRTRHPRTYSEVRSMPQVTDLEDKDLDLWRASPRPLDVAATSAMVSQSRNCITWQRAAVAEFTSRHIPGPHPLWRDHPRFSHGMTSRSIVIPTSHSAAISFLTWRGRCRFSSYRARDSSGSAICRGPRHRPTAYVLTGKATVPPAPSAAPRSLP